jgi:predicted outer membrane lipoprotein
MPNFAHVLGLAVTFAAIVAFLVEPTRKPARQKADIRPLFRAKQAASNAEYEAIFLFSLLGLLLSCALLPRLIGAPIALMSIG